MGPKLKGLASHIEQSQGLAQVQDILKKHENHMTEAAAELKEGELLDAFPKNAFGYLTVVDFEQGCDLTNESTYAAFAKDKNLEVNKFKTQLGVSDVVLKVDDPLLNKERLAKKEVVNCMTSIHLLDLLSEKIDQLSEKTRTDTKLSSSMIKAITRTLLPILKIAVTKWFLAKMRIRRVLLQDRTLPGVMTLMRSSLWDANIFPSKEINELKKNGAGKNMISILGIECINSKRKLSQIRDNHAHNTNQKRRKMNHQVNRNRDNQYQWQFEPRNYEQNRHDQGQFYNQRGRGTQRQSANNRSSNHRGPMRGRGISNGSRNQQKSSNKFREQNDNNTRENKGKNQDK